MRSSYAIIVALAAFGSAIAFDDFSPLGSSFGESRIIGGAEASEEQFPYQAGLLSTIGDRGGWCGGVLVSNQHVLTAAHCAANVDFIDVYLGAHEIRNLNETGRMNIRVDADHIVVHEAYVPSEIRNDIALLTLPEPINFTSSIRAVDLPSYSDVAVDFASSIVTASGWGRTNDELGSTISPVLKFARVNVQPESVCKYYFGGYILQSNICTETAFGQGICNGDSGGPVVIDREGKTTLLGLSSFVSSNGCVKCWPSVFVRVSYFLDWIKQHSNIQIAN